MRLGTYYRFELLKKLGIFKRINKDEKILDIGGFDGFTLSKLEASEKILIDPDAKKEFSNIKYLKEDFFSNNFKNKKFGFIISLDVLEHIPQEKEFEYFTKIYSLLEKRGVAIMTTPSKDIKISPKFLIKWVSRKWGHDKCIGYTKEELERLLKIANIKKYNIYSYHSEFYLNNYLLLKLLQLITPKFLLEMILLKIANKDAKLDNKNSNGYYLIKIKK